MVVIDIVTVSLAFILTGGILLSGEFYTEFRSSPWVFFLSFFLFFFFFFLSVKLNNQFLLWHMFLW